MTSRGLSLPAPDDAAAFEQLCVELFKRVWNDHHAQPLGVSGQDQKGIDIVGRPAGGLQVAAVQCKVRSKRLAFSDVLADVEKADQMHPPLNELTFATTARRDAALQCQVLALTLERASHGKFPISIMGWDDLCILLATHLDVARPHFPVYFNNGEAEREYKVAPSTKAVNSKRSERLRTFLALVNDRSHAEDLTISEIAEQLGLERITELDDYFSGADEPPIELLKRIADLYCISSEWIVHGKGSPFYHSEPFFLEAHESLALIRESAPEEIIFVRSASEFGECVIVLKYNEWKYHRLNSYCHVSAHVGGTGSAQLLSIFNLITDLSKPTRSAYCVGQTLSAEEFENLVNGEVFPGAILEKRRFKSLWWDALLDIEYEHSTASKYADLYGVALVDAHRVIRKQIAKTAAWAIQRP